MKCARYCSILLFFFCVISLAATTIILVPWGDATQQGRGRIIGDSFERTISWKIATEVQQHLRNTHPHVAVLISRQPGDVLEPWATAQYANHTQADCAFVLGCYPQNNTVLSCDLYMYRAKGNNRIKTQQPLRFLRCDQAYQLAGEKTHSIAQCCAESLRTNKTLQIHGPFSLPCTPLCGFAVPAVHCEWGLPHEESWRSCVMPLVDALKSVILLCRDR
jgi:hypothetical protein